MIIVTILSCIVATIAYFLWKRQKLASTLPPGPPAWPLIGNLLQIDRSDPRKTFVEWHKKYGPIYTVWLGAVPNVFVTGFDLMQELFVKRGDEFADRPNSFIFDVFTSGKYGIVNIMGEMWKEQRRFSLHTLRNFGFGRKVMEEKVVAETTKLLDAVNDEISTGMESANLDIKSHVELCVSNIISSLMVGRTYQANDPEFKKLKDSSNRLIQVIVSLPAQLLDSFPWLRFVPLFNHFSFDDLQSCVDDFFGVLKKGLAKSKERLDSSDEPTDFAAAYWKEIKRRQTEGEPPGYFDDWQLICVIGDIWGAAIETTVTTLYWAVLLMMHNPEVQKKVQEEIDAVVGGERCPDLNDKSQMPYTAAVINEIQRYSNIIIVNIPHTVSADSKVMSYTIPKGVTVIPQISVVHYDDTLYHQPTTFDPDRFLDTENAKHEHLLPFSLGKRICLGESLARMELYLIFTALMQKFTFAFVDGEPAPSLNPKIGFTAGPQPYRTRVVRRQPLL